MAQDWRYQMREDECGALAAWRLAAEAGEDLVSPGEVAAGSVQICRQEEMRPRQWELENKAFIRLCVKS